MRAEDDKTCQRGFTLIEMAIAMSILGLMLGGGMLAMTAILDKAAMDETLRNMDKIETALLVYMLANNRLPCPDTNYDGAEDTCSGTAARGIVPYRTIGVLKGEASDGYDRFISYVVDVAQTAATNPLMCGTSSFADVDSILAVTDAAGNASIDDAAPAYALVYHGKNGLGAIMSSGVAFGRLPVTGGGNQPAEYDNSRLNTANPETLRAEPLTAAANVGFDDVIRAKPAARILYDAGCTSGT